MWRFFGLKPDASMDRVLDKAREFSSLGCDQRGEGEGHMECLDVTRGDREGDIWVLVEGARLDDMSVC